MEKVRFSDYTLGGIIILAASATLLIIATLTNRSDITSATLFLSGVACFLGGVFLLTFSGENPPDTRLFSLLPVSGPQNIARICAELGLSGNAWFFPPDQPGGQVREYIPVSQEKPGSGFGDDRTFVIDSDLPGIVVIPAAAPLIISLEQNNSLRIAPGDEDALASIKEVGEDMLEIADKIDAFPEGSSIIISVQGYRLLEGCRYLMKESPKCCTQHPCGICSLSVCLLARSTGQAWQIERVALNEKEKILSIQCTSGV